MNHFLLNVSDISIYCRIRPHYKMSILPGLPYFANQSQPYFGNQSQSPVLPDLSHSDNQSKSQILPNLPNSVNQAQLPSWSQSVDPVSSEILQIIHLALLVIACGLIGLLGLVTNIINIMVFVRQGFKESINISLLSK